MGKEELRWEGQRCASGPRELLAMGIQGAACSSGITQATELSRV